MYNYVISRGGCFLLAAFLMVVLGCLSSNPVPVQDTAVEPWVLANPGPPSEWAEIHVTRDLVVKTVDGLRADWGPGTRNYISSGPHALNVLPRGKGWSAVSLSGALLPGRSYLLKMIVTDVQSHADSGGIRSSANAEIELLDRGFTEYAVPAGKESIVEFTLTSTLVLLNVDGRDYELSSSGEIYAGRAVRLFLSPGTHVVRAFFGEQRIEVLPNRFISYSIGTDTAQLVKKSDQALGLTGKWIVDAFGDKSVVVHYTFSPNMTGYSTTYSNGTEYSSGGFDCETIGGRLTMRDLGGSRSMEYSLSADGGTLTLHNFLGEPITVTGIRQ